MRDVQLFLSFEHSEVIIGLFIGLIVILCLREQGGPGRGRQVGEWLLSGAVRTHTTFIKFAWFIVLQNSYNDSKDH